MRKFIIVLISCIAALNANDTINYYGDIVNIKLSKDSWNRIIFDAEVNAEPIYSKEKNLEVYKANNSVFVKFKPMVKVEVLDKQEQIMDIDYSQSKKSELFVSTTTGTYSFTIEPASVPAKTYIIQNVQNKNTNLLKFEMDSPRKVFKDLIKSVFINEQVDNYEKLKLASKEQILSNLIIKPKYIFRGKIYSAYLYDITALETVNINEKIFTSLDLRNKRAIAVKEDDRILETNQTTQLIIIVGN